MNTDMDNVAYENLKLLMDQYDDESILICDNNKLSLMKKDSFDPLCKIISLEYPIYYTYHHLLNTVKFDKSISYLTKKYLLEKIEESLENCMKYINDYDENGDRLINIINDIDEKYDLIKEDTMYSRCERIIYLFDDFVDACKLASKYLYFSPRPYDILRDLKPGDFYEPRDELELSSDDSDNNDYDDSDNNDSDDSVCRSDNNDSDDSVCRSDNDDSDLSDKKLD